MTTFPAQISPSVIPTYPHVIPAVPDTMALGTHSLILYNGLILNDRQRPDLYKIEDIDGLGGADIRDSREPRQAAHGEIAHDAYWGGQTITLTGKMEAGSMQELTRMERDLRAAFGSLVETPMKFNWWDVVDQFYEPIQSNAYWKALTGNFSVSGGKLTSSVPSLLYYSKREYYDVRVVAQVRQLSNYQATSPGPAAKITSSGNYIFTHLWTTGSPAKQSMAIGVVENGTEVEFLTTVNLLEPIGNNYTSIWCELRVIGDVLELIAWNENPDEGGNPVVLGYGKIELSGARAELFGYGVSGYAGLNVPTAEYAVEEFKAEGIYPGDLYLNVRPVADPIIKGTLQSSVHKFKKEFQLAVRASDPHIKSCVPVSTEVTSNQSTPVGFGESPLTVINRGNWVAQTIAIFRRGGRGAGSALKEPISFEVRNLTTGETFAINKVPLPSGNPNQVIVDSSRFLVQDQGGNSLFQYFDPTSSMITLAPGANQLELVADSNQGIVMRLFWNHTFK